MSRQFKAAFLYHNYYSLKGISEVQERLAALNESNILLLTSIPEKFIGQELPENTETEKFLITTNQGKDIGGKLLLLNLILTLYPDIPYLFLLHDKRSYQKYSGTFEKEMLFDIISPEKYSKILSKLNNDPQLGLIGPAASIKNEFNAKTNSFRTTNSDILKTLQTKYQVFTEDYRFVAGTMFCVRTSIFRDFFRKHNPIEVKATLETGNILDDAQGTVTHSWERLLGWIVTAAGYKIEGV